MIDFPVSIKLPDKRQAHSRTKEYKQATHSVSIIKMIGKVSILLVSVFLITTTLGKPSQFLESPNCMCPMNFEPVCGKDGQTYPNACGATCFGQTVSINHVHTLSKSMTEITFQYMTARYGLY